MPSHTLALDEMLALTRAEIGATFVVGGQCGGGSFKVAVTPDVLELTPVGGGRPVCVPVPGSEISNDAAAGCLRVVADGAELTLASRDMAAQNAVRRLLQAMARPWPSADRPQRQQAPTSQWDGADTVASASRLQGSVSALRPPPRQGPTRQGSLPQPYARQSSVPRQLGPRQGSLPRARQPSAPRISTDEARHASASAVSASTFDSDAQLPPPPPPPRSASLDSEPAGIGRGPVGSRAGSVPTQSGRHTPGPQQPQASQRPPRSPRARARSDRLRAESGVRSERTESAVRVGSGTEGTAPPERMESVVRAESGVRSERVGSGVLRSERTESAVPMESVRMVSTTRPERADSAARMDSGLRPERMRSEQHVTRSQSGQSEHLGLRCASEFIDARGASVDEAAARSECSAVSADKRPTRRRPRQLPSAAELDSEERASAAQVSRSQGLFAMEHTPWTGSFPGAMLRIIDLEPERDRGRLLMLLGTSSGGVRRVAFYNGHPEVELECELWAQGMKPLGDTALSIHPEYKQELLSVTVQPGCTVEFAECAQGSAADPQPGWRTKPLQQRAYDLTKDRADEVLTKDYRRLHSSVSPDAPEMEVLEEAARSGVPFVDLWFLPQRSSLAQDWEDGDAASEVVTWSRPSGFGKSAGLFASGPPRPTDVRRGALPDGYLLCCLAALAELSETPSCPLRAIFSSHRRSYQDVGGYKVTLLKDGWWREVAVDDFLPSVFGKRGVTLEPAFARCAHHPADLHEMWVPIIEKGYARLHGSYSVIANGHFYEGLADLTGYPAQRIAWQQTRDGTLWNDLARWSAAGALVMLHTPGADQDASGELARRYEANGLALGHGYAILGVHAVAGHRLVQIRNPWPPGAELWRGRWASDAQQWADCPEVGAALGADRDAAWSLWLSWPEVMDWFRGGSVCHVCPDAGELRVALPFRPGSPAFVFEVECETPMRVWLGVHQRSSRGRRPTQVAPLGCMNVTVLRPDGAEAGRWHRVSEKYEWGQKDFLAEYEFVPGEGPYIVCVYDHDCGGGGPESGLIHEDIVVTWHYSPLNRGGSAVLGTVSMRSAEAALTAIQYNPIRFQLPLSPVEAFCQQRRHIASQPQPVAHTRMSTVRL
eukprot:TRINITY_DN10866_c0_g1_i1.p1 TRINITY_DN10866_c0_g1~~TRINITY_DN10866_c0_g1_i1.p1  ORF type:complete len:1116 (+),score=272.65 TRINITY_DN10866_c0_g1_i1:53-3400(+)